MEPKSLIQVVSGGQTGADIAGLRAAKKFGLKTGGLMPKGFRTTDGPHPDWAEEFGLKEHPSSDYRYRTLDNILTSSGTVILSYDFDSPGTMLTVNKAIEFSSPRLEVNLNKTSDRTSHEIAKWITDREIVVLNVAGNSAQRFPQIEQRVFDLLCEAFQILGLGEHSCEASL